MYEVGIVVTLLVVLVAIVLIVRRRSAKPTEAYLSLSALPERFVVFDFETTGLDCTKHEILEIGAIRVNRDSDNHDTFQCLVIPKKRIGAKITEITGIDRRMVEADGAPLSEVLPQFREFVGDLPMVAFNAEFDVGFLRNAEQLLGLSPMTNEVACALRLARAAWPGLSSYRLTELAKYGNLNVGTAHRALTDCHMTMIVYSAAMSALSRSRCYQTLPSRGS